MNALIESGLISEMEFEDNFAYIINDNSLFSPTEYKFLQNNLEKGYFIKCMKLLYNGKIQFFYLLDNYKPLESMISDLDADSFMTIINNIFSNIISIENIGFLHCKNIDISFDRVYVDPNTYKVKLVYLPISKSFYLDDISFSNELRATLIDLISNEKNLSSSKTIEFMADLSNGMLSIKDLYQRIQNGKFQSSFNNREINSNSQDSNLHMVSLNAPKQIEIIVNKDDFIIGKNPQLVDGPITFNRMISRKHCKVIKRNEEYMIVDLNSSNGTYLNRSRLIPNKEYPIKNNDVVRLANSDFQILID